MNLRRAWPAGPEAVSARTSREVREAEAEAEEEEEREAEAALRGDRVSGRRRGGYG
jgi:hypothetical protein